ncbi:TetR/AcrR family transcriptional regulator [Actinoplanes utahensis]|uniref:TetR family transcriptional regulator n=1 Tax=Actinoplanes utahensis TaxID=1869 RepID=A0A0A6UNW1_ACTUT|nr:TetR/AcrR family transcriptional regulator [Actinoplanes utahensis]KHD76758.1 TetR family transcriptional regulator [Actinoplanes utahensis]GIF33173.1 hypothetical protein Aut01nite_61590 [Actinoplanes utahensis]
MPRPTKQQIDDEILEAAAHLFARHGFKETSIQRIADTVGYSKTGLLHRFPTKEALQSAVIDRCVEQIRDTGSGVSGLPAGPERDRAVLTGMATLAAGQPGMVALLLSSLLSEPDSEIGQALQVIGQALAEAFGDDLHTDTPRALRVTGALGAVAVASIALCDRLTTADAPARLAEIGYDALGHPMS